MTRTNRESITFLLTSRVAQWSARWAHNPQVVGSKPTSAILLLRRSKVSPAGNRTRVTRVTGGYTNLYTTEDAQGTAQTAGFEPAHAEHTRLAGEPRNHLGTSACGDRSGEGGQLGVSLASWCSGSTSDSKSDNGGSIPSEVTFAFQQPWSSWL